MLVLTVGGRTGGAGLEPGCVCGAGLSKWSPKILPAPSCVVFTMVVDIVDMFWFVLRHECIVDQ